MRACLPTDLLSMYLLKWLMPDVDSADQGRSCWQWFAAQMGTYLYRITNVICTAVQMFVPQHYISDPTLQLDSVLTQEKAQRIGLRH